MNTPPTQQDEAQPSVLVIDDAADVHRLLKARLRHEDIRLLSAFDGREALQMVRRDPPAVILLDLDMPGMDGFEVLRHIKDDAASVNIPVVVLSGLCSSQDKVTAFDLGAIDYITKPFNLTELRVRVRSALRLHDMVRMLAQRAQIDGLTGLWNRAHFDRRWAEETATAARYGRPLSIALLDVDHFKSINDTYGHPAGDAVLQGLSKLVLRESRQSDVACRYGGEEFALILPDTSPENAAIHCERLRAALASVVWPRHPERSVTMSIGIAGVGEAAAGASIGAAAWLEAADKSLYKAKKAGRNRTVTTPLVPAPHAQAA